VQAALADAPLEEINPDRPDLRTRASRPVAPEVIPALTQPLRSNRRREISELEVSEIQRQAGEDGLVVAQCLCGCAPLVLLPAVIARDVEAEWGRSIRAILHGLADHPGRLRQSQRRLDHAALLRPAIPWTGQAMSWTPCERNRRSHVHG